MVPLEVVATLLDGPRQLGVVGVGHHPVSPDQLVQVPVEPAQPAASGSQCSAVAGAVMGVTMAFLDLGAERSGTCVADGCVKVFLDTSRNRSRRFGSDRCANRTNVAALRSRRRDAAAGSGARDEGATR